jgi:hypothetical protein
MKPTKLNSAREVMEALVDSADISGAFALADRFWDGGGLGENVELQRYVFLRLVALAAIGRAKNTSDKN